MLARIALNENFDGTSEPSGSGSLGWNPGWAGQETRTRDEVLQALRFVEPPRIASLPQLHVERFEAPAELLPLTELEAELKPEVEPELDPGDDPDAWYLPPPDIHTTGTQLRRRLVTPESIAELAQSHKPTLLQRLLRRR